MISGQGWARVTLAESNSPQLTFTFSGRQLEPIIAGLTLVPVVGVVGLIAAKGWLQRFFGLVIFLIGSAIAYLAFAVTQNWQNYVGNLLATKLGRVTSEFTLTTSPLATTVILPAIGIALVGFVFTIRNFDLAKRRGNYESAESGVAGLTPWQALDAGYDPTISISD